MPTADSHSAGTDSAGPLIAQSLVVDSSFRSRRKLIEELNASGMVQEIVEAHSVSNGLEELVSKVLSLCIIGPSLSEKSAVDFIRRGKTIVAEKPCAFVAVVDETIRSSAVLIEAGADGTLILPYDSATFSDVIVNSFELSQQAILRRNIGLPDSPSQRSGYLAEAAAASGSSASLASALYSAAKEFRSLAQDLERGKLKINDDGEPTLTTREAIRRTVQRTLAVDNFEAQIRGSFDHFFVNTVVEWFVDRVHYNEKSCTERLRRKLLTFK